MRYHGKVGYASQNESKPGVYKEVITEVEYFGDVVSNTKNATEREQVIPGLSVGNSISIVADAYAMNHFFAIRYIEWAGSLWSVDSVDVRAPRLLLRLGGVYNGPRGSASPS